MTVTATPSKTIAVAFDELEHSIAALVWTFDYILNSGDKLVVIVVAHDVKAAAGVPDRVRKVLQLIWSHRDKNVVMNVRVVVGHNIGQTVCHEVTPSQKLRREGGWGGEADAERGETSLSSSYTRDAILVREGVEGWVKGSRKSGK
ncbi:hypothetical protein BDK51DRAFT_30313 [Blyttiomyces helicus]|uniref:Uncharacterized protein n=1 Tax=Blyttiomyces helicus TaxID=388810 RepID=A0A4P9W7B8_9FUNG|nr:hypothetical protein BDK51DRAFT_30313 [Blyttiomyces helicus]|eukprot:RKO86660.1 hypothetical protein BDK51DRAFT_30313 [Blyttiomyces helicus]